MAPPDDETPGAESPDEKPAGAGPADPKATGSEIPKATGSEPEGSEADGSSEKAPAAKPGGRHVWIPDHKPGVIGTLKGISQALAPLGRKRVLAAGAVVFGIGIVGIIFMSGFSFWWTSQPSFCAKCHPMQKFVDAWAQGPHKDVTCEKCHVTPGLFGFIGGKIAGLQVVMNYVRGNYEDYSFNAAVGNASCLQCHEGILSKNIHTTGAMDVLVSHRNIVENGAKCVGCHSTVAHGDSVPIGSQTHPTMSTCMQCHNGSVAPVKCSLCHVSGEPDIEGSGNQPSDFGPTPSAPPETLPSDHPAFGVPTPTPSASAGGY